MFITLANTIFGNSLREQLPVLAPGANATAVVAAGATAFRSVVAPQDLPGVILAFSNSVDRVFYMTAGLAGVGIFVCWEMGWHDIRKKDVARPEA